MKKQYLVSKPADFNLVIDDILSFVKEKNLETLTIALEGDLGAGKTTFTQELGKKLGATGPITSPTFTIMKQYSLSGGNFGKLVHIDAYRIESEDEVGPLHLRSVLIQPKTIICVEWPEKIQSIIPSNTVQISINIKEGEVREVEVLY